MNQLPEPLPDLDLSPKWQRAIHFLADWLTFFDRDGKGFHDSFSGTYVIRRKSLKRELAAEG